MPNKKPVEKKPVKFTCADCGQGFAYENRYNEHREKYCPKLKEPAVDPENEEAKKLDADVQRELTSEVQLDLNSKKAVKMGKSAFKGLFAMIPKIVNGIIKKLWPEGSENEELAKIWVFDEDEIDQMSDLLYVTLDTYFPQALVVMGQAGFLQVMMMAIAVGAIFVTKITKTVAYVRRKKKEKEEAKNGSAVAKPAAVAG